MLIEDPPVSCAQISDRLGIPVSILDRHAAAAWTSCAVTPAIAALIDDEADRAG
jgi:hypothetical protein